jgi:hypothetical protein
VSDSVVTARSSRSQSVSDTANALGFTISTHSPPVAGQAATSESRSVGSGGGAVGEGDGARVEAGVGVVVGVDVGDRVGVGVDEGEG